jgi:hypothetical protein
MPFSILMHMQNESIELSFVKVCPSPIYDDAFQGTLPTPQALKPNTHNSYYEINWTKVSFGNRGHNCATIISSSHSRWALGRA